MKQFEAHGAAAGDSDPALYVVATPIGNLGDVTLRALAVLKSVALIAAEDTRVTAKLLDHYGISTRLIALHAHNERSASQRVLRALAAGKPVALVSDAGTPGISDPGAHVVAAARAGGHRVVPVPGASALAAALSAAGLPDPRFLFQGFLPQRAAVRRRTLETLRAVPCTLVFYEAPHRIRAALSDLAGTLGPTRRIVIARELTKLYETIHACMLGEAVAWIAADDNQARGEFVLVVEGAGEQERDSTDAHRVLQALLAELPLKQAVSLAVRITGAHRNELYAMALDVKNDEGDDK